MRTRLLVLVTAATVGAAVDIAFKASVATPVDAFHQRSHLWLGASIALLAGALALAAVPSRAVALAAGVAAGGVLGNLASGGRVPDPILAGGVAFNLADVLFVCGIAMLVPSLAAVSVRERDRLIPPRRWERALARRLRRTASAAGSRRGTRSSRSRP